MSCNEWFLFNVVRAQFCSTEAERRRREGVVFSSGAARPGACPPFLPVLSLSLSNPPQTTLHHPNRDGCACTVTTRLLVHNTDSAHEESDQTDPTNPFRRYRGHDGTGDVHVQRRVQRCV